MKTLELLLALFWFTSNLFADSTFYGAWYTTKAAHASKDAGSATVVLRGDLPSSDGGDATIFAVVNARGTFGRFPGAWKRTGANTYRVEFGPERPESGQLNWRGSYNSNSGQCTGTWSGEGKHGRFLTQLQVP